MAGEPTELELRALNNPEMGRALMRSAQQGAQYNNQLGLLGMLSGDPQFAEIGKMMMAEGQGAQRALERTASEYSGHETQRLALESEIKHRQAMEDQQRAQLERERERDRKLDEYHNELLKLRANPPQKPLKPVTGNFSNVVSLAVKGYNLVDDLEQRYQRYLDAPAFSKEKASALADYMRIRAQKIAPIANGLTKTGHADEPDKARAERGLPGPLEEGMNKLLGIGDPKAAFQALKDELHENAYTLIAGLSAGFDNSNLRRLYVGSKLGRDYDDVEDPDAGQAAPAVGQNMPAQLPAQPQQAAPAPQPAPQPGPPPGGPPAAAPAPVPSGPPPGPAPVPAQPPPAAPPQQPPPAGAAPPRALARTGPKPIKLAPDLQAALDPTRPPQQNRVLNKTRLFLKTGEEVMLDGLLRP